MKNYTLLFIFFLLLGQALVVRAQGNISVTGKVTGQDNQDPLPGATVVLKGSQQAVVTNPQGVYSITLPTDEAAVLIFNYLGYKEMVIPVGGRSVINVALEADNKQLSEVVVIGYGSKSRKDLTTSVGTVEVEDIVKARVRSVDEALAGRVAGVQVNSSDGQPGAETNIMIRGANSVTQSNAPLYVIDGFPIEGFNLNNISPQEIESMSVLKDAAATAIYGARAANGVIVINTKKGKAGAPVITFNTSQTASWNIKRMKLMNPYEFVKYNIERLPRKGPNTPYYYMVDYRGLTEDNYEEHYKNFQGADWQNPFFQRGFQQNYDLAIRGGNEQTTYSISGNVNNQKGTIINTGYKRYQGRIVLDQKLNERLKVGVNLSYAHTKQHGQDASAGLGGGAGSYILYNLWGYSPLDSINTDKPLQDVTTALNGPNDFRFNPLLHQRNVVSNNITNNLNINSYAEWWIIPNLKLRITGVINTNNERRESFNNSQTQYGSSQGFNKANGVNGGITNTKSVNWANENTITWNKNFNNIHRLNILAGFTMQGNNNDAYGFSARLLPNEGLSISGLEEGTINPSPVAESSLWRNASFLSRISYDFKSRYYIDFSYRADGTSRFASANHWGFFPGASVAWRFKEEPFLKTNKFLSDGKFRVSYGATGNNRGGDFAYRTRFELPANMNYSFNNSYAPILSAGQNLWGNIAVGNQQIKWETVLQADAGIDLSFFNNRIELVADWYRKKTKDLILSADVPLSSGYTKSSLNIGSVQNTGWEFTVSTVNLESKNFKWSTSFNISFNRNKLLELAKGQETLTSNVGWDYKFSNIPGYIAKIGQPLGLMYGWIWDGNYQYSDFNQTSAGLYVLKDAVPTNGNIRQNIQPGDIKYRDINGDGIVNANDFTVIGRSLPKHFGGFTNNFKYKQFDLNVFFQWSYGNDIQNNNRYVFEGNALGKMAFQQFTSYEDRWTPSNQDSKNYRAGYAGGGYYGDGYSSRTVEDGSYLRLKTVSLGYQVPQNLLLKSRLKAVRIFASAQNLVSWTKYTGLDPEVSTYSSVLTGGFDYSAYPRALAVSLGADITF